MKIYYTTTDCPFTDEQIKEAMFGINDTIKTKAQVDIPYFSKDPLSALRYDDYDVYDASSMAEWLQTYEKNLTLGSVLIVNKKLILSVDTDFTNEPEDMEKYKIYGLGSPFLCVIMSTFDLNADQSFKVLKHEFGHFYGLPHCKSGEDCIMLAIEGVSPETITLINKEACSDCMNILNEVLQI